MSEEEAHGEAKAKFAYQAFALDLLFVGIFHQRAGRIWSIIFIQDIFLVEERIFVVNGVELNFKALYRIANREFRADSRFITGNILVLDSYTPGLAFFRVRIDVVGTKVAEIKFGTKPDVASLIPISREIEAQFERHTPATAVEVTTIKVFFVFESCCCVAEIIILETTREVDVVADISKTSTKTRTALRGGSTNGAVKIQSETEEASTKGYKGLMAVAMFDAIHDFWVGSLATKLIDVGLLKDGLEVLVRVESGATIHDFLGVR